MGQKQTMPIPFKVKSESEIPAEHKTLYVKKGDVWVLDAAGAEDAERVAEFRDRNIALMKEAEKFKDIDPEKYRRLTKEAEDAEQKRLKDSGKLEEAHAAQVAAMKNAHAEELKKHGERTSALTQRLETVLIDDAVAGEALKKGVRATALLDVKTRARNVFNLDNDKVTATNGGKALFGRSGEPLTIGEWLDTLATEAPHLFEGNSGSGSGNNGDKSGGSGEHNPYKRETWNLTRQAQLERTDAAKANRMKAAAGAK